MRVIWSAFARQQYDEILGRIARELSTEDAARWYFKFEQAIATIEDFPFIGAELPQSTHRGFRDYFKGLRQTFVGPYRIVYRPSETTCEVLFCQRTEQMLAPQAQ